MIFGGAVLANESRFGEIPYHFELTPERYAQAIDIFHRREKARLLRRLEEARKTRGPWYIKDPDRNLSLDIQEEADDHRGYTIAKMIEDGFIKLP